MDINKRKFLLKRVKKMSKDGFQRLSKRTQLNFKKEVYISIGTKEIDPMKVYNEKTLAYWLLITEGQGVFTGHFWTGKRRKSLGKEAFRVEIWGDPETKWSYAFKHIRGISRYGFWRGD